MSSSYTKDLILEVAYKLQSNDVYSISKISTEWSRLVNNTFWLTKFIRDFGSNLPNGANYEETYLTIEKLYIHTLYLYVVTKGNIKLLVSMLAKWKPAHSLLLTAAIKDNIEIVKLLLDNEASINIHGDLALIYAAENGNLEIVKLLVANGANIHARKDRALVNAAANGYFEVVEFLLGKGADITVL